MPGLRPAALVAAGALATGFGASAAPSPPPASVELALTSHGARLNALLYQAAGPGPHPVVMLLHGFPGNERNLDVAQGLRRAGMDVLYFDYRGTWGSAGTFSFGNGLEDVAAVLEWVRAPAQVERYGFDPGRVRLFGHSYGGWLALHTAARDPAVRCVATLAAWNLGYTGRDLGDHPETVEQRASYYRSVTGEGAPVQADAAALIAEVVARATDGDSRILGQPLADHAVLLMGGTRDSASSGMERQAEIGAAIRAAGGRTVRVVRYADDHAFGAHRLELTDEVRRWFSGPCARAGG